MERLAEFMRKDKAFMVFLLIFAVGLILRFYNIPLRYTFDPDAVHDQIVAYQSVKEFSLPLIGSFSSAGDFTFGPWYYYHIIVFQFLTGSFYSAWLVNTVVSVITIFVMYLLGKYLYDAKLGVILALLTAVSPAQIYVATGSSNLHLVFLYVALSIFALVKILKHNGSLWWSLILGLSLGIAVNAHFQTVNIGYIPVILLVLQKKQRFKSFAVAAGGFVLTFIPLFIFNVLNNWHTVRGFTDYLLRDKSYIFVPNSWKLYIFEFWPRLLNEVFGLPIVFSVVLLIYAAVLFAYLAYKKKIPLLIWIFSAVIFVNFVYMRFYWGERHPVYFFYLQPFLFVILGYIIREFMSLPKGKYLSSAVLVFISLFALIKIFPSVTAGSSQTAVYDQAAAVAVRYEPKKVKLYACEKSTKAREVAIPYILEQENLISDNGVPVAFPSSQCTLPSNVNYEGEIATHSAFLQTKLYPYLQTADIFDFSRASEAAILEAGWQHITPDTVHDYKVNWWKDK